MRPANPFDAKRDPDRHHIWHRQMIADSEAFIAGDWGMIADDFDAANFEGIRCNNSADPAKWEIAFATLDAYRDSWLAASREFVAKKFVSMTPLEAIFRRTHLERIDLAGDVAICHKQFYGDVRLSDGTTLSARRQTLYRLHRKAGVWKIVGFLGQLPLDET